MPETPKIIFLINKNGTDVPIQGSGNICIENENITLIPEIVKAGDKNGI